MFSSFIPIYFQFKSIICPFVLHKKTWIASKSLS